jgi:hypothetical protein
MRRRGDRFLSRNNRHIADTVGLLRRVIAINPQPSGGGGPC